MKEIVKRTCEVNQVAHAQTSWSEKTRRGLTLLASIMGLSQHENLFIHPSIFTKSKVYNVVARSKTYLELQ